MKRSMVAMLLLGVIVGQFVILSYALKPSQSDLERLAFNKIQDLMVSGELEHTNTDGCDFDCRVERAGKGSLATGENLYKGSCDLENALRLWKESPTHNAILNEGFEDLVILGKRSGDTCYLVYNANYL